MEALFFSLGYICRMKQTVTLLFIFLAGLAANGQVTDTLGFSQYQLGTEILYTSPNGGYAFGNNGYSDIAKAQSFVNDESLVLRSALIKFGAVQFGSLDSASAVQVNVYTYGGSGVTLSSVNDSVAPDTIRASVSVPVYQLVENDFTEVDFGFDTIVFQSDEQFFIGVDVSGLAPNDTVGLLSTTDEDAGTTYLAWELTANNDWVLIAHPAYSWNLDVDLAIFAVIDEADPAGIAQIDGFEWSYGPNPCVEELNVSLPGNAGDFTLKVVGANGQVVYQKQTISGMSRIDVSNWSKGVYFIEISNNQSFSAQKVVKL